MMAMSVPASVPRVALYLAEPTNEGVQRLREILMRQTFGAVARRVGVDKETVRQWAREEARPSRRHRSVIELRLGVPAATWEEAPRWPA
jgi:DNA-binding transcriptional regulator YiaG